MFKPFFVENTVQFGSFIITVCLVQYKMVFYVFALQEDVCMKNKLVIYIIAAYFMLLTVVLISQLPNKDEIVAGPINNENINDNKLKDAIVLYIDSPVALINQQQVIIDRNAANVTPVLENGKAYVPVRFISDALGANISWNKQSKETILRLNNKAMIFTTGQADMKVIDNTSEKVQTIDFAPIIVNERAYLPLRLITDIFGKEIYYNDGLIIISNSENVFNADTDSKIINELVSEISGLPKVRSEIYLKELVNYKRSFFGPFKPDAENTEDSPLNIKVEPIIDGDYIFDLDKNGLTIFEGGNIISKYIVDDVFQPKEMYLNENMLFVIGNSNHDCNLHILDISNKNNIKLTRTVSIDGDYFQSRIIDDHLYMISSISAERLISERKYMPPSFYDSLFYDSRTYIGYNDISFFPDMADDNFIVAACVNINDVKNAANVYSFLGGGENFNIFDNCIIAATNQPNDDNESTAPNANANVYRFSLNNGVIEFDKFKNIKGNIKNALHMIQNEKNILTVSETQEGFNLTIFNDNLDILSQIHSINSDNYKGNVLLNNNQLIIGNIFVDVSSPENPVLSGKLNFDADIEFIKHIDDNRLLVISRPDELKIDILDISDINNIVSLAYGSIGGADTNIKAEITNYFADYEENYIAIPFTLLSSGNFTYQGAYVYNIENGFTFIGRVSDISGNVVLNQSQINYSRFITQVIIKDKKLYTISDSEINVYNVENLTLINKCVKANKL